MAERSTYQRRPPHCGAEGKKAIARQKDLKAQQAMACFAEWMFYSAVAQIVLTVIAAYLLYRTLRESRKTNRIGLLGTAAARRANSAARKANDIAIESGKKRVNRFAVWKELMFFWTASKIR